MFELSRTRTCRKVEAAGGSMSRLVPLLALLSALSACVPQPPVVQPVLSRAGLADADTLRVTTLAPGVWHTYAWYAQGPWAAHIIEIDQPLCRPQLEARKPGPSLAARATTSALTNDALVGINADFFRLPGGTPVGAHVTNGVPLIGPTDRQIFAASNGDWWIGIALLDGSIAHRADSAALAQINRSPVAFPGYRGTTQGVTLFTSWSGDTVSGDSSALRVPLRMLSGNEGAGTGVVMSAATAATTTRVASGEAVLFAHGNARAWAQRRSAGDTVRWHVRVPMPAGNRTVAAQEVVGGFPELLRNGEDVLATQTVNASFGEQRHPRTAVGWSRDHTRLFLVLVDGREAAYSAGMSLPELSWLFRRVGASDALNLDGGGSSAMVVERRVVNRPSDAQGERAVGNALVVTHCAGPATR
jgi:hypothetical protein